MDLHPEEGPNILSLFYSKARLNGKIPKPSLGRKYSGKKKKKEMSEKFLFSLNRTLHCGLMILLHSSLSYSCLPP